MCGLVGYLGRRDAQRVVLDGLKHLEYRGYDSWGMAVLDEKLAVFKREGKVSEVGMVPLRGALGIGHTRWATHGAPSECNAHPHVDCSGQIAVVHNGVFDNFQELRERLSRQGHKLCSETDTEVLPHLIEQYYRGDLMEAVRLALGEVRGSYAIIVLHARHREMVAARRESPLVLGLGDSEFILASDVSAMLEYTDRAQYLEDGDLVRVTSEGATILSDGHPVARETYRIPWGVDEAQKGGYEHFMLKEIHEQPRVLWDTLRSWGGQTLPWNQVAGLVLLGCGTAYHAAMVGKTMLGMTGIPVWAEVASEFGTSEMSLPRATWAVGITQSGETADTLQAMQRARRLGCHSATITNTLGSSASRAAEQVFYMRAGPEISVAATKTFLAQLLSLALLTLSHPATPGKEKLMEEVRRLPVQVQRILDEEQGLAAAGQSLAGADHVFFVGKGLNWPVAQEGALKLKEISYIHAEGYPAGELKHGPFALLTPETPVVALVAQDHTYQAVLNSIKEIKARGAPVLALAPEGNREVQKYADSVFPLPAVHPLFSPFLNAAAVQLLAYYAAHERGCAIDTPRNLAKSVTVT